LTLLKTAALAFCLPLFLLSLPVLADGLAAPDELIVERDGDMYKGRWQAVPGASYYEVWVKNFGRWTFNPNTLATSPFTSSFEIRVEDERARFKVRAVDTEKVAGEYSAETVPVKKAAKKAEPEERESRLTGGKVDRFDPDAPPPAPPTGLFTVWTEPDVIKLVWQDSKGAKNYAVEEYSDGKWTSPARIEFPRKNAAIIKNHPAPGPYKFRIRAVGNNGRASEPSRTTTAQR
jgi:hypothetical protein